MVVFAALFNAADAAEEFADIVCPPPLAVADHVQTDLFLQADCEHDVIVERLPKTIGRQFIALRQQVTYGLWAGQ